MSIFMWSMIQKDDLEWLHQKFLNSEVPRSKDGYYIQSTGDFTGFEEIKREGNSVTYKRTNSGTEGKRKDL